MYSRDMTLGYRSVEKTVLSTVDDSPVSYDPYIECVHSEGVKYGGPEDEVPHAGDKEKQAKKVVAR